MGINFCGMLAATTALSLFSAGSAQAQLADADDQSAAEIVVTAQKREERLIEVPAAISVVGGARLEEYRSSQLADIAAYVPGLQIGGNGSPGQTSITLRGIAPLGSSATVGVYIDEAPVGSSSLYARGAVFAADLLPYDIERIEVLKGPQGTLYGASSIGGLLKYVTKEPDLDDFEVRGGGDIFAIADSGDVGYAARAGINLPIVTDKLAIRGSYAYQHTPGYIDNTATGAKDVNRFDQQSARLSLIWQASERLSLKIAGMWQSVDAENNAIVVSTLPAGYTDPLDPRSKMQVPPSAVTPIGDGRTQAYVLPEHFRKNFYYATGTAELDLDFATFISASSYARSKTSQGNDLTDTFGIFLPPSGRSSFTVDLDLEKYTQELRLASSGTGPLEWMVGGFYTHEKSGNRQIGMALDANNVPIAALNPFVVAQLPTTYEEYALFGEVGYSFADVFELTAGLRWAHNSQDFRQESSGLLFGGVTTSINGASSDGVWTYSLSGRYAIGPKASIYGRVATGYRPGGPNIAFPGIPPEVGADRLTNYELGVKADVLGGTATVEAAVFLMDWDKIQLSDSIGAISYAANAGSARAKGFELSATVRPARGFNIGLNAAYIDARLTADALSLGGVDGARLPLVPKFTWSIILDYATGIGGDWRMNAGTALRFVSDRYSLPSSAPDMIKAPDYVAIDANIGVTNGRWTARLFAKNLTDSRGALNSNMRMNGLGRRSYVAQTPIQPRTIGLAMDVRF